MAKNTKRGSERKGKMCGPKPPPINISIGNVSVGRTKGKGKKK